MSHQVEGFSCQAIAATSWATGSIPARGFIVGLFVTVNKIVYNKTINEVSWTDFEREKIMKIIAKRATISVQSQVQHFYNAAHMPSANLQNNIRKHLFQKYIISIQEVVYVFM